MCDHSYSESGRLELHKALVHPKRSAVQDQYMFDLARSRLEHSLEGESTEEEADEDDDEPYNPRTEAPIILNTVGFYEPIVDPGEDSEEETEK